MCYWRLKASYRDAAGEGRQRRRRRGRAVTVENLEAAAGDVGDVTAAVDSAGSERGEAAVVNQRTRSS